MAESDSHNNSSSAGKNSISYTSSVISGIILLATTGLLVLSAVGAAGVAGSAIYTALRTVLGVGYWVLATAFTIAGFYFLFGYLQLPSLSVKHGVSGLLFGLSVLSLIHLLTPLSGGVVGRIIAAGTTSLFSVYAGAILLEVVALISVIVLFDEFIDWHRSITLPTFSTPFENPEFSITRSFRHTNSTQKTGHDNRTDTDSNETADSPTEQRASADESGGQQTETESGASGSDSDDYTVAEYDNASPQGTDTIEAGENYTSPPVSLLDESSGSPEVGDVKARANKIKRTLENFNITVEMDEVSIGPTVTRYALKPAEGVRLNKITNLQNNLELALAAHPVRIEAPIPGKSLVGVEVPNDEKTIVSLSSLLGSERFQSDDAPLLLGLGQDISGDPIFTDLNDMPHLLIGGATGSGKSVTIHSLINSLLFRKSPEELKMIMVDPKRVELTLYDGIPHLLTPVITSAKKAILALKWAAQEMDRRYDILEETGARDIRSYHDKLDQLKKESGPDEADPDPMPYIVVVIDEMADLMQAYPKELESVIVRIAQMSRAVGIHLVLSTQRPDVNVITGLIKANIPARIALQVSSNVDSRTILDQKGAEQLLGDGDMLFQSGDMPSPVRVQSAYISEEEVKKVVSHLEDQYDDELQDTVNLTKDEEESKTIFEVAKEQEEKEDRDEKYEEALETIVKAGKASTSYLQRKLRIGYSRAARIMDQLEENGIITEKDGTKARDVLITEEQLEAAREGRLEKKQDKDTADSDDDQGSENSTETASEPDDTQASADNNTDNAASNA